MTSTKVRKAKSAKPAMTSRIGRRQLSNTTPCRSSCCWGTMLSLNARSAIWHPPLKMPSRIASLAMRKMMQSCINAVWAPSARNAITYAVGNHGTLITTRPDSNWTGRTEASQIATNAIFVRRQVRLKRIHLVEVVMIEMTFIMENSAHNVIVAMTESSGAI